MDRAKASKYLRDRLDEFDLKDWKIRIYAEVYRPFLGMCDSRTKTITLNSHHIDTHPDLEVVNTINHEIAHALVGSNHGHDSVWAAKARELGCDNTLPCASYELSAEAIDAIRSGASLEVEFTEETQVIRKMNYKTTKLVDKCEVCGALAIIKSTVPIKTKTGKKNTIFLKCGHIRIINCDSQSHFEDLIFDGSPECNHKWGIGKTRTICTLCGAKRLYEYQIAGAQALEAANGRLAIFDEMGLGKTIQALAYLKYHPEMQPFLWITKSGIKFQHGKEIIRILGRQAMPQVIMTGKDQLIPGMNTIASYSIFRRLDRQMFIDHGFKSVILDECQAIKNPDSSQTGEVRQIVRNIPSVIPLSGTPWKNRGSEFFVVLNMLDPTRFNSYEGFKRVWVSTYWDGNKEKEGGISNPAKFKEFISNIAIRRERAEVMPELPLINRTKILCEVDKAARNAYQAEESKLLDLLNNIDIGGGDSGSFEAQSQIQKSIMIMRQIVGIAKVPTTVEFVEEFLEDTDRKIVVFVHHKECDKLIYGQLSAFCAKSGLAQPLRIGADLDSMERNHVQELFNGKNYRVLVASTLASGEGLNLQSCSDCVMHERQWNPANEEQAEGRFIRLGRAADAPESVNAVYVHGDDTVDTIFDAIVEQKRRAFHETMNNSEFVGWSENNILSEMINQIRNRKKVSK